VYCVTQGKFLVVRESRWGPNRKPLPPRVLAKFPLDSQETDLTQLATLPDFIRDQVLAELTVNRGHRAVSLGIRALSRQVQTIGSSINALDNQTVAKAVPQSLLERIRDLSMELVARVEALQTVAAEPQSGPIPDRF
jgi:hypothetical protein